MILLLDSLARAAAHAVGRHLPTCRNRYCDPTTPDPMAGMPPYRAA